MSTLRGLRHPTGGRMAAACPFPPPVLKAHQYNLHFLGIKRGEKPCEQATHGCVEVLGAGRLGLGTPQDRSPTKKRGEWRLVWSKAVWRGEDDLR